MKESSTNAAYVSMKQQLRAVLLDTVGPFMKKSSTNVAYVTMKQQKRANLLDTVEPFMKESSTNAWTVVHSLLINSTKEDTTSLFI